MVWSGSEALAERLDTAMYAALAGTRDADTLRSRVNGANGIGDGGPRPVRRCWWRDLPLPATEPDCHADAPDAALLERLVCGDVG